MIRASGGAIPDEAPEARGNRAPPTQTSLPCRCRCSGGFDSRYLPTPTQGFPRVTTMLTLPTYGLQLETTFKRILKAAGIRQAEGDFNAPALLLDATRIDAQRVAAANKHRLLHKATAEQLLDWVYGIDHLIDVNGGAEPVYAAIDLTANGGKANAKELKAQRLRPMWQGLGVEQFFIVHVDGDLASLAKAGTAALIDKLWADMEKAFNGPTGRVHVIHLQVR
jgi:hypothetical protein